MKTLLVVPEIRLDSKPTIVPFWAGILASIIENKNGQVAILDLNALRMKFGGSKDFHLQKSFRGQIWGTGH